MTTRHASGLVASLFLLAASGASAGTLTSATWLQVAQGFPMSRTSGQLGATGSSTAGSIAMSLSYPAFATKFFVPKTPNGAIDLAITITQGGAQALTATPGMASATQGIPGTVIVMTANHAGMGVNQSMYAIGVNTLVASPLSAGKAGQATRTFIVSGAPHYVSVDFYAWTPGTVSFASLTTKSAPLPSVVAMGSFNLTANGGGTVTLVSPTKLSIDGSLAQRRTASVTTLKLYFVPEAGELLLLASGALCLGLVGRRAGR